MVLPIEASRSCLLKVWPSEVSTTAVTVCSRGSVLRIVKGTRNGLPTTPVTGQSRLAIVTSGSGVGLPVGTASTGMPARRRAVAACTGGRPSFQLPSEASTIARRFGLRRAAVSSGPKRSVPAAGGLVPSLAAPSRVVENGSIRIANRSSSGFQNAASESAATDCFRDTTPVPPAPPVPPGGAASRCVPDCMASSVSILRESSISTAIEGFSLGRCSVTHSG